jgi:hypothetical protein
MKDDELSLLWHNGKTPEREEFEGMYKVVMYPRWLWWWFVDVKKLGYKIWERDWAYLGGVKYSFQGHNIAFGFLRWGRLKIKQPPLAILFDYSKSRWPFRNIRDYVRRVGHGYYIGKFYYILPIVGHRQLAWFTLRKITKEAPIGPCIQVVTNGKVVGGIDDSNLISPPGESGERGYHNNLEEDS